MTERGKRLCAVTDALMSEVNAGGELALLEPIEDLTAVCSAMGKSWLQTTGGCYAEIAYGEDGGLGQARLHDLRWGMAIGYQIARREASAAELEKALEKRPEVAKGRPRLVRNAVLIVAPWTWIQWALGGDRWCLPAALEIRTRRAWSSAASIRSVAMGCTGVGGENECRCAARERRR